MTLRFRHLIWDMDGTLFDTYPAVGQATQQALQDVGVEAPRSQIDELLQETLAHCIRTLAGPQHEPADILERYWEHYHRLSIKDQTPFPGVCEVCERFIAAGGQHFIFTHRPRASLEAFLRTHEMDHLFVDTLTVDDGYPRKPDPAGFLALIERYHLSRADVLAIGDRVLDIVAGERAGLATCLYGDNDPGDTQPTFRVRAYDNEFVEIIEW